MESIATLHQIMGLGGLHLVITPASRSSAQCRSLVKLHIFSELVVAA